MDHATRGLFVDGSLCEGNANAGTLVFKNNIVAGYGQRATEQGTFNVINTNTFVAANSNDTIPSAANILTTPYSYLAPDYRPAVGSIALTGASFTTASIAAATIASTLNCLTTNIKKAENTIGVVSLFPNPTADAAVLMIETQNAFVLNVIVTDITGKVVLVPAQNHNLVGGENKISINTSELNNGIYFVTLNTINGKETVKLVVSK